MVKERKIQTGASNLSARGPMSSPEKLATSLTHKLICPDEFPSSIGDPSKARIIKDSATWRPAAIYSRKFESVAQASFKDPSTLKPPPTLTHQKSSDEIFAERERSDAAEGGLIQFVEFVKSRYGTTASMLRKVKFAIISFLIMSMVMLLIDEF
jgi:hypothetical protein